MIDALWNRLLSIKTFRVALAAIAVGTAVSLTTLALGGLGVFDKTEVTALSFAFLNRPQIKTDPSIVSIDIDDKAIESVGRWPWPLEIHASLIELSKLYKSRSVIFTDIDISKTGRNSMKEKTAWLLRDMIKDAYTSGGDSKTKSIIKDNENTDGKFYDALRDYGNAFYTFKFTMQGIHNSTLSDTQRLKLLNDKIAIGGPGSDISAINSATSITLPPSEIINNIRGGGSNIVIMDRQGVVFRYPLITRYNDTLYPSVALDAAIRLTGSDNVTVKAGKFVAIEGSKTGRTVIPIDKRGQMLVSWAGSYKDTFQRIPFNVVASFIVLQEAKNQLRKYGLKKMQNPDEALTNLTKELKKLRYVSPQRSEDTASLVYVATLIENRLNSTGCTVKEALEYFDLSEEWTRIGNQIKFNNYLLQKYDETEKMPLYEEAVEELGLATSEADTSTLKDAYDLVIHHLGNDSIPLVRPLYFDSLTIFTGGNAKRVTPLILKDKIIFYGLTATGLTSQNPTPFMKRHPMLDLPVNVLNSILTGRTLDEPSQTMSWLMIIALAYCIALSVLLASPAVSAPIVLSAVAIYVSISWYMFSSKGIFMPVSQPLFTILGTYFSGVIYRYIKERHERLKVKQMFSAMVSPEVLKLIEQAPEKLRLGGEIKRATMFSSDVSGFTTISEGVTSRELADILNIYLTPMSNIIMSFDGYVDKYEGDAIKADFGVPLDDRGHAWKACWAALYQQEELVAVARMILLKYGINITARMGVNTGKVLVGNMGSEGHIQYTAMGPAATLADELEPANKLFGTWIIISSETYEEVKDYVWARCLGDIKTHRSTETVYELVGWNREKFLAYWDRRPIAELMIKSLTKLRPEKILGYHHYFNNKTLPALPLLAEIRRTFSELSELSIQYMQLKDIIDVIIMENDIDELRKRIRHYRAIFEQAEIPDEIDKEMAALHSEMADEYHPHRAALLNWQITLKRHMAHIAQLKGKVEISETEPLHDMADRLEKAVKCLKKRIDCPTDETMEAIADNIKDLLSIEDLQHSMLVDSLTFQCRSIERLIGVRLNKFANDLRSDPSQYHHVVASLCDVPDYKLAMISEFEKGLSLYKRRLWDGAFDAFNRCLEIVPDDGPSKKYIEAILRLKETPPPHDWTGVWESG